MAASVTFTFQLPVELEKESKAKKGITMLMLLRICTNIDYNRSFTSKILFSTPSNGMEEFLVNHALLGLLLSPT
jgi:hypothetical protein